MKKKILLVSCIGLGRGGVQAVLMSIVRNLSERYIFDIILFTSMKGYYEDEFLSYGGKIHRICNYDGNNSFRKMLDRIYRIFRIYKETDRIIKENGPYQAVHCNNYYESAYCLRAAYKNRVSLRICHIHAHMQYAPNAFRIIQKWNKNKIFKYATDKIACSKEAYISMFGNKTEPDVYINSYNKQVFDSTKYPKVPYNNLIITQVGSFSTNKNQMFTVHILSCLKESLPNVQLNLVGFELGGSGYKESLEKEIATLELQNHVRFWPHDTNIAELLSNSTISIIPSRSEGFCIAAIESQAMGVPVFASDTLPEVVNAGGCTFLPLELGASVWASQILNWYETNKDKTFVFDCSIFEEEQVLQKYIELYERQ